MTTVLVMTRAGEASLNLHDRERLGELSSLRFAQRSAAPTPSQAVALLRDVDVLVTTNACLPKFDRELLDACPRLREVVLFSTGYDHVNADLLARRNIVLSTLPDYATQSVAEHALALILAGATRLVLAHERSIGRADDGVSLRGVELAQRQLGIIGLGRIGRRLATLGQGIGMQVVGADLDPGARRSARDLGVRVMTASELSAQCDVVAVCASTLPGSARIVDAVMIERMRPDAFLVNVARPGLVDTEAVVRAIRARRLRGYAVDDRVLDPQDHADLITQGRVLQTDHSAWWRDEALDRGREALGRAALAAVLARSGSSEADPDWLARQTCA